MMKKHEQGQAMVLIVFGMVVLLGFTALAIDGSILYSDRRYAQNASDAASLAGGGAAALSLENNFITESTWDCDSQTVIDAAEIGRERAIQQALVNGFSLDEDLSDDNGVETRCGIDTSGTFEQPYLDIRVKLTDETRSTFAHFVFQGRLRNTVESIVRIRPSGALAHGYAIVALNPDLCSGQQNGANFHGEATIYVEGGGIFSNGCMRGDGVPIVDATGEVIQYVGDTNGNFTYFTPAPEQVPDMIDPEDYTLDPEPNCEDLTYFGNVNGSGSISQGRYGRIRVNSGNDYLLMNPGLYCVEEMTFNGGKVTGHGVTIVATGDVTINGNVEVELTAPPPPPPNPEPAVPGILFYVPPEISIRLQINGNENSLYVGVILAAGSDIDLLGNGQTDTYQTQVIGWNVEVGGNADTHVRFNDGDYPFLDTFLDLYK